MDRGQAYTLEGTVGAIIVVTAVLLGLQAVDTGPWTATPEQVPEQLSTQADDLLTVSANTGALSNAIRCWGADKAVIDGTVNSDANSPFEQMLKHTFDEHGRNYNIYLSYWNSSAGQREERLVTTNRSQALGAPDQNSGVATRQITLYDHMRIRYGDGCRETGYRIGGSGAFEIPDVDDDAVLYNVVEVRLVVW